jgi:hypothetical protein
MGRYRQQFFFDSSFYGQTLDERLQSLLGNSFLSPG